MSAESQLFGSVGVTNMSIDYIKQLYESYFAMKNYLVLKANLNKMFQKTSSFSTSVERKR